MPRSWHVTTASVERSSEAWYAVENLRPFQIRNQNDISSLPIALSYSLQLILLLDGI